MEHTLTVPLLSGAPQVGDRDTSAPTSADKARSGASGLPSKPVHMNFGPATVAEFKKMYQVEPILSTSKNFHRHPHCAFQRNELEQLAHRRAYKASNGGVIYNVGAAPNRVQDKSAKNANVRCLVPQLQPGDAGRLASARDRATVCEHTLQECLSNIPNPGACPNCVPFYTSVFTHSIYYIPPADIVAWLEASSSKTAYAICHTFEGGSGALYTEGNWWIENGDIVMRVEGNSHTYRHPQLPWANQGGFSVGDKNVDVVKISSIGATILYQLTLVDYVTVGVTKEGASWASMLVDTHHTGPIFIPPNALGLVQSDLATQVLEFDMNTLRGDGNVLYVQNRSKVSIVIPRGLISEVANVCVLRERNPALLAAALHKAHRYVETARVPIEHKPFVVTLGVVFGMNVNVVNEVTLLSESLETYSGWHRAHATVLSFLPVKIYGYWYYFLVLLGLTLTALGVAAASRYDPSPDNVVSTALIVTLFLLATFISCAKCYYERVHRSSQNDFLATLRFARTANPVTLPTHIPPSERNFAGTTAIAPPLPVPRTPGVPAVLQPYQLRVTRDPNPPKQPLSHLSATPRTIASGIIPDSHIATAVEPNQAAEISGITNRILVPVTEPDPVSLARYLDYVENNPVFTQLGDIVADDSEACFQSWVKKYPEGRRKMLAKAREEVQTGLKPPTTGRGFLKVEKGVKVTIDGEAKTRPRMITSFHDGITATTGPYICDYTDKVCARWNKPPIVYTRGMSAEKVAQTVEDYTSGCYGILLILENDFKTMDATVREPLIAPHERRWMKAGATALTQTILTRGSEIVVKTRHGVKAKAPRQISSGEPTTNLLGSMTNAGSVGSWAQHLVDTDKVVSFLLLVMGDDGLLFLTVPYCSPTALDNFRKEILESFHSYIGSLGLLPVATLPPQMSDATFCSKLFWPTTQGPVLAPMPGRIMARLGWSLTSAGAANIRGAAMSLQAGCQHIPFLRLYLQRTIALTKHLKERRERRSEEWEYTYTMRHTASGATWQFFWERYGLTEKDEEKFGKLLNQITSLPSVINSESMTKIIARDV